MLHIKDIEAFAHINEALASPEDSPAEPVADEGAKPAHPALVMAMMATGRLSPAALNNPGLTMPGGLWSRMLKPRR